MPEEIPSWFKEHAPPPGPADDAPSWFKEHAPRQPTWGEQALQMGEDVLKGAGAGAYSTIVHGGDIIRRALGLPHIIGEPDVQKYMTPPPTTAGRIGFGGEQTAEYFLPIGPEIKGAGLAKGALRVGKEALRGGLISGAQTGTLKDAATGAALGAGAELLGVGARKVAPKIYEKALRPAKKFSLEQRAEMAEWGVQGLPFVKSSLEKLKDEVGRYKPRIDAIIKNPQYGGRSIRVADLMRPVDALIAKVRPANAALADDLLAMRQEWVKTLELGSAATTTVAEAQKLKESLDSVISSGAFSKAELAPKLRASVRTRQAARGAIEQAVPEKFAQYGGETLGQINQVIHNDLNLKDAITDAMKGKPNWLVSVGINRREVVNERVMQERSSEPS
jgi:hypothetical protein